MRTTVHLPLHVPKNRRPTTPGELLLKEFLRPMGITQTAFAAHTGMTDARLNAIIKGKRAVTPDTAMRFGRALGTSVEMWVRAQLALDLYDAQHSAIASEIKRIRPIRPEKARGRRTLAARV